MAEKDEMEKLRQEKEVLFSASSCLLRSTSDSAHGDCVRDKDRCRVLAQPAWLSMQFCMVARTHTRTNFAQALALALAQKQAEIDQVQLPFSFPSFVLRSSAAFLILLLAPAGAAIQDGRGRST